VQAVALVLLAALLLLPAGRGRPPAAAHLHHRLLHGAAVAGLELGGRRDPAARQLPQAIVR
jgi:hypothetical protein